MFAGVGPGTSFVGGARPESEGDAVAHETTTSWPSDELTTIGRTEELGLASLREDGTLRPYATIWVVCAGDELYVRPARGPANGWFVRALRGEVTIRLLPRN